MHIKKITIENFKCIEKIDFFPDESFNVIVGENNQGKTTIFEALRLWYRCYFLYINKKRTNFYSADINFYLPFKELEFLRMSKDTDIFKASPNICKIGLTITLDGNDFTLAFQVSRPKSIANAYLRVVSLQKIQFNNYANALRDKSIKLDEAITIYETKPIANVLSNEPFMTLGQIKRKIIKGKSQEVLRNKILRHSDFPSLSVLLSRALDKNIELRKVNGNRKDVDEYISLVVKDGSRELDIYLQGSGFLQLAEIFATLDFLNSNLNILLIDEPDSHLHLNLQKKLIAELREVSHNQTFIISHNDAFVGESKEGELFYLNEDAKSNKELKPLEEFDLIRKDLGGPIISLEKLNSAQQIVFVEGPDDDKNINLLAEKYIELGIVNEDDIKKSFFFMIRGKDDLINKIDHNKRALSQLFRDKKYIVVTDKDFTNQNDNQTLNSGLIAKLGRNSIAISHDCYCMESTMFTDLSILKKFIIHKSGLPYAIVNSYVDSYIDRLQNNLKDVTSFEYKDLQNKFESQKKNRAELSTRRFNEIIEEAVSSRNAIKYIMNKNQIRLFIEDFENVQSTILIPKDPTDDSDDYWASTFFQEYIRELVPSGLLYNEHKSLLNSIFDLNLT